MIFLKYYLPFIISLILVYFLGYLYQYDFGFDFKINDLLTESVHFIVFAIFGFATCRMLCKSGKIKRPHAVYAFAVIFFVSTVGVFNEIRIHPEHGDYANLRDILFHLSAGILGMIIWRLTKKEIV